MKGSGSGAGSGPERGEVGEMVEKKPEESWGAIAGGGGLDSKMEKSAVLQGSVGSGGGLEVVGLMVGGHGSVGVNDWGWGVEVDRAGGGGADVNSDSKSDGDFEDFSSAVSGGPEDSKSAKSSSSFGFAVVIGDIVVVFGSSSCAAIFSGLIPCSVGFWGVLFADPVGFFRRPGPITPISASNGMNFPGPNRADVGDTVPLRRTIGDACFDNGAWIGDIFADLGVDAGVDKVGLRLRSWITTQLV